LHHAVSIVISIVQARFALAFERYIVGRRVVMREELAPMGYYDELSEGSKLHRVRHNKGGIRITPADGSDECLAAFQDIVKHAIKCSVREAYVVTTHTSSVRSGRPYEAIVLRRKIRS
jgi:hypothetical protein